MNNVVQQRTNDRYFDKELQRLGSLLYNIIHSREAIDEKFVDKYLYDEDTIDYQMTKIYHESAHNENAHSKYLFASIKGGYTKTNIYHCIRKATNSICIISGQYDENSIEIAKQYQKHVPAIAADSPVATTSAFSPMICLIKSVSICT